MAGRPVHRDALDGPGNFYPPTVLADIPDGSPGHRDEFFGLVALLWRAQDVDDAIRIANDSPLGLAPVRGPGTRPRDSGYGREIAEFGPRSFVNAKTVWIAGDQPGGGGAE